MGHFLAVNKIQIEKKDNELVSRNEEINSVKSENKKMKSTLSKKII